MGKKIGCFLVILLLGMSFVTVQPNVYAKVVVNNYQELKSELEREESNKIELGSDIYISGPITIHGSKTVDGKGHYLERSKEKGCVYGGTLFLMLGKQCEWKNVVVSGASASKNIKGKIFGRLLEIRQGKVILGKQSVWKNNKNEKLAVDGGGAIWIRNGGTCDVKGGAIVNNANVSCGAGFRIDYGGSLLLQKGQIRGNVVTGIGKIAGFDGVGAAIYNEGDVCIYGGDVSGNQAVAYRGGNTKYGGAGGAIYNKGRCVVLGGRLKDNMASQKGQDFYGENGSVLRLGRNALISSLFLSKTAKMEVQKDFRNGNRIIVKRQGAVKKVKDISESTDKRKEIPKKTFKERKVKEKKVKEEVASPPKEKKSGLKKKTVPEKITKHEKEKQVVRKQEEQVHFASSTYESKVVEEWHFSPRDIKDIKKFMDEREDPFSQETNIEFIRIYQRCRRGAVVNE